MDRFQAGAGIQESEDQIVQKYLRLAELKSFEHFLNRFSTICVFLALFLQVVGLSNVDLEQDSWHWKCESAHNHENGFLESTYFSQQIEDL